MNGPRIIAHRGLADQYPENTVLAIVESTRHVDMIEIDAQPCATEEIVVFHDEELDRLTDATGRVDETPLSRLRELDVNGSGEPIPTLSELLAAVPDGVRVNLELKAAEPAVIERTIGICERHGTDVLYSSFSDDALRSVRELRPEAHVAVLNHRTQPVGDRLALAREIDAVAYHPGFALVDGWTGAATEPVADPASIDVGVAVDGTDVTTDADVVALAHGLDLVVNVWTAPDADAVRELATRRVDGVMVDHLEDVPADATTRARR